MSDFCDSCINSKTEKCKVCTQASFNGVNLGEPTNYEYDFKCPPLGLKPKREHDYQRVKDIVAAMQRYIDAHKQIPLDWVDELYDLISYYAD